jgi:hypothetical protein
MNKIEQLTNHPARFVRHYLGGFSGILRWRQLDELWQWLNQHHPGEWYLYQTDTVPPAEPLSQDDLGLQLEQIDQYLRHTHKADYCGVVYVDDPKAPTYIKVYNPKGMGSSCSMSEIPPLPKWIISLERPENLKELLEQTEKTHPWWQVWK